MKLGISVNQIPVELKIEKGPPPDFVVLGRVRGGPEERLQAKLISRSGDRWTLELNGKTLDLMVTRDGDFINVEWNNQSFECRLSSKRSDQVPGSRKETDGGATLVSRMPGTVIKVLREEGDLVEAGEGLVIIEAMKMQNELSAPRSGRILVQAVKEGATVNAGDLLFEIG